MVAKKRCLLVRWGTKAGNWLRNSAPRMAERVEVAGLIDINGVNLVAQDAPLKLPADKLFTDLAAGFAAVDADFCLISTPPVYQKQAILLAIQRGLPVLCDKPMGNSWEECSEIYRSAKKAGLKVATILYFHNQPRFQSLLKVVREGNLGRVNYVVCRLARDCRVYGSWGAHRHEMEHAVLMDGGSHQFELLRELTAANCRTISGWEWNPAWSAAKGGFCGMFVMEMTNGAHASYEFNNVAAGEQNSWQSEYLRVECESGAVAISRDNVVRIYQYTAASGLVTTEAPMLKPEQDGHDRLLSEFLDWLDGGAPASMAIENTIHTNAMVFAAIEASRGSRVVDVQAMVDGLHMP